MTKKKEMLEQKKQSSEQAVRILLRPRMTEKAHSLIASRKYVFQISSLATKLAVKRSVETVYGVKVLSVNIVRIPRRHRVFGRVSGWRSAVKKAIVTLKEGENIELFKGV
ncbi:MAG: 50S ribosomal protein L23 [Candidatus Moraniibacteriota bacterium]|nr:MAG: 50S ribosomal protein L23 [Candidatus Moranbacteria bacterium]